MKQVLQHKVFNIFEELSQIPRESGHEEAVSNWIADRMRDQGLEVEQDAIWNLIVKRPASKGYEKHPPVLLQAHMDMVCEKNSSSTHDFRTDPIKLALDGDWIISASGTTLGADNGIGVSSAIALLEDDYDHPPLEVVFTVQEETTFAGAEGVDVSGLKSQRMINLDHSDEQELIVGSCGGTGVELTLPLVREAAAPEGLTAYRIKLSGLKGGHSGEDIHRGHGNAISLLLRVLEDGGYPVLQIDGGTNRLAIPREAEAEILAAQGTLTSHLGRWEKLLRKEYSGTAPELTITCQPIESADLPLTKESFGKIAALMRLYPNGISNMNGAFDGRVESSDNIGILKTSRDSLQLVSEVRGAYQTTVEDLCRTINLVAGLLGASVEYFNAYVPWEFEANSHLRALAVSTYDEMFHHPMKQLALHAGLECGFFAEKIPGLDLISIGPNCWYFHSPEERVSVASTQRFYEYLKELLRRL